MSGSVKSKPGGRLGAAIFGIVASDAHYGSVMDDAVQAFMRELNDGFPAVETMTADEARAVLVSRRLPVENLDDVAIAEDFLAGDVPARIYRPHGGTERRPAVVFCHGGGFVLCDLESHDGFCRAMARNTESVVISVDYRLRPGGPG